MVKIRCQYAHVVEWLDDGMINQYVVWIIRTIRVATVSLRLRWSARFSIIAALSATIKSKCRSSARAVMGEAGRVWAAAITYKKKERSRPQKVIFLPKMTEQRAHLIRSVKCGKISIWQLSAFVILGQTFIYFSALSFSLWPGFVCASVGGELHHIWPTLEHQAKWLQSPK